MKWIHTLSPLFKTFSFGCQSDCVSSIRLNPESSLLLYLGQFVSAQFRLLPLPQSLSMFMVYLAKIKARNRLVISFAPQNSCLWGQAREEYFLLSFDFSHLPSGSRCQRLELSIHCPVWLSLLRISPSGFSGEWLSSKESHPHLCNWVRTEGK